MNILITGANGFIGKNLIAALLERRDVILMEVDKETEEERFNTYCREADFIFHLAGVNRPDVEADFMTGNRDFTAKLLENLKKHENKCPVMLSSSIQAALDNPYGRSKREAEELLLNYGEQTGASVLVYRFPNVFGKWSRPDYNTVVATFCHRAARGIPIRVDGPDTILSLVYIDDLVDEMVRALAGHPTKEGCFYTVPVSHSLRLGDLAELILSFRASREDYSVPDLGDPFIKKLYSTYLSFLPEEGLSYPLVRKEDERGSFAEFIRTPDRGQISVNITKPGVIKGNHWHRSKTEKFLVIQGQGTIRLRRIDGEQVLLYPVLGNRLEVVEIPPGYTHQLENTGQEDLITVMWANEAFDPDKPDTFFMEV